MAYIKDIFHRYLDKTCTEEELWILLQYFELEEYADELQELVENELMKEEGEKILSSNLTEVVNKNHIVLQQKIQRIDKKELHRKVIRWVAYAASLFIISTVGFFYLKESGPLPQDLKAQHDISPAKPFATISLGNGDILEVDTLKTGLIFSKEGLYVYKDETGVISYENTVEGVVQDIIVSTPKGGFTKLRLSDGTLVELNANSNIRYPSQFDGKNREVFTEGEVYFEVFPDKKKPFLVHSDAQTIEVLGTTFNLSTHKKNSKTTLLEGSVKIIVNETSYFLKPGQQSVVTDKVEIKDVKAEESIAWVNEEFLFDNSSFIDVLREIENWYDVTIYVSNSDYANVKMSGAVSRKVQLSELLKVIEMNTNCKFEIEGRRVLVKKIQ